MSPRGFGHAMTLTGISLPVSWAFLLLPNLSMWAVGLLAGGIPLLVLLLTTALFWRW
jgi:hypothetical protein